MQKEISFIEMHFSLSQIKVLICLILTDINFGFGMNSQIHVEDKIIFYYWLLFKVLLQLKCISMKTIAIL